VKNAVLTESFLDHGSPEDEAHAKKLMIRSIEEKLMELVVPHILGGKTDFEGQTIVENIYASEPVILLHPRFSHEFFRLDNPARLFRPSPTSTRKET
ncbi:unnamed protein product, partial [marine sediment metagenome]